MTVSSIVPVNNYTGNNSVTKFDFDFLIESQEELVVNHIDKDGKTRVLQFGIDYSISEIGNKNGSYITFPLNSSELNVLGSDEIISLTLSLDIKQESKFENSSNLNLSVLEKTFDYIVRILQILNRAIERCMKVSEGANIQPSELIKDLYDVERRANISAEQASTSAEDAAISASAASDSATSAQESATSALNTASCFDEHATEKQADFDNYSIGKIAEFDSNVTNKTNDFNANASQKQSLVDQKANEAEIWAEGTDVQVAALGGVHSAKVWAEQNSEGMNVGMSNISESGENKLEAQKAYITGNVLTDSKGYAELEQLYNGSTQNGLDILKPDNYAVVGNPTITEDGLLSDNSLADYVSVSLGTSITNLNQYKVKINFIPRQIGTNQILLCGKSVNVQFARITSDAKFRFVSGFGTGISSTNIVNLNKINIAEVIYTPTKQSVILNGIETSINANYNNFSLSEIVIGRGAMDNNSEAAIYTDIDLNSVEFYIDGNLIYQPCLKIPYTLSKTGSKIVDVSARERVIDAYEQGFKEIYYTIDETNKNYTIPIGEIYGMIENSKNESLFLGQTIMSDAPLIDTRLKEKDGSFIPVGGAYDGFINDYINPLYERENTLTLNNLTVNGSPTNNNGIFSNLVSPNSLVTNKSISFRSNFSIRTKLKVDTAFPSGGMCASIFKSTSGYSSEHSGFGVNYDSGYIRICEYKTDGTVVGYSPAFYGVTSNSDYDIKLNYVAETSKFYLYVNDMNTSVTPSGIKLSIKPEDTITFGGDDDSDASYIRLDMNETFIAGIIIGGAFISEEDWQNQISQYGFCNKYVYTEGVGVRLPKYGNKFFSQTPENNYGSDVHYYIVVATKVKPN